MQQSYLVQNDASTVRLYFNAIIPGEHRGEHGLFCTSDELSLDDWHLLQVQQFKKGYINLLSKTRVEDGKLRISCYSWALMRLNNNNIVFGNYNIIIYINT